MNFTVLLVMLLLVTLTNAQRRCKGSDGRLASYSGDASSNRARYLRMREHYKNCSIVEGNLEIVWFPERSYDFGFLEPIREVMGYVLIKQVHSWKLALPNLRIIRAKSLYREGNVDYGLFIFQTEVRKLVLPNLRDVVDGSIGLFNNPHLCNVYTINWDELVSSPKHAFYEDDPEDEDRAWPSPCAECDDSCEQGCWGEGPDNCQRFSKETCSNHCWQGRCFGPNARDCCHPMCAGGCHGPANTDCLECKYLENDGACVPICPPLEIFNLKTNKMEHNPDGKYAHGSKCVKKCPEDTVINDGTCVASCPPHKKDQNGECVPCKDDCPKTCQSSWVVHSDNIDNFVGCTKIVGSIVIENLTFDGFQDLSPDFGVEVQRKPMHPDRLDVFSTVKEITGSFEIKANHADFLSLSYFRNLEIIGTDGDASLKIIRTSLKSLDLRSLKKLRNVNIEIRENKNLCYASMINWSRLQKPSSKKCLMLYNKKNLSCIREGLVCDKLCSEDGCWGPGPTQCLSCKNFFDKKNNVCAE